MNKPTSTAKLVSINYDVRTFAFAAVSLGSDLDLSFHPMGEPFPEVKDQLAGDYSLFLSFVGDQSGRPYLQIDLLADDQASPLKTIHIPVNPRFSEAYNAFETMISETDTFELGDLNDVFAWLARGHEELKPVNADLKTQHEISTEELGEIIGTKGQQNLITNLSITIQGNASILLDRLKEQENDLHLT